MILQNKIFNWPKQQFAKCAEGPYRLMRLISGLPIILRMISLVTFTTTNSRWPQSDNISGYMSIITALLKLYFWTLVWMWNHHICLTLVRFVWHCRTWRSLWAVLSSPLKLCGGDKRLSLNQSILGFFQKNVDFYEKSPARHRVNWYEEWEPGETDKDTRGEECEIDVVANLR